MQDQSHHSQLLASLLGSALASDEPMSRHSTLRVGGPARWFWAAKDVETLAQVLSTCFTHDIPYLLIGHGSNLLMSDRGYDGLIIQNRCKGTQVPVPGSADLICSETGVSLGSLFQQTARAGFSGLEWGVGIPGTVGGALVSNAGAYRGNIGPLVHDVRVFADGEDQVVSPAWMEFAYRDSKLRRAGVGRTVILSCTLKLTYEGDGDAILKRANYYQDQRRSKQPYHPSAGSFFKNVTSHALAESLPSLSDGMRESGVVPAGHLIELTGLKGLRLGGAQISEKHANFLVNVDREATAQNLYDLANLVKQRVHTEYGVWLEEEVLYVGDWEKEAGAV